MTFITINNTLKKSSIQIDTKNITKMSDIVDEIQEKFDIKGCQEFKLLSFGRPPRFYKEDSDIKVMCDMMKNKEIRDFKISYKIIETPKHGDQEIDMSPVKNGIVKSGFSRYVNKDGGDVTIGNSNGASITIPAGALGQSTKVSIKEVDMVGLNIGGNVTRHVPCDMKKVNSYMNK